MRIDIDHLTLPEPEAVALLKSEVRRLRAAIAALADQDKLGNPDNVRRQGGKVGSKLAQEVGMKPKVIKTEAETMARLTDEERAAVKRAIETLDGFQKRGGWHSAIDEDAATLRSLLERL